MVKLKASAWGWIAGAFCGTFVVGFAVSLRAQMPAGDVVLAVDDARLQWLGQLDDRDAKHPRLGYPGTGVEFRFRASSVTLDVASDSEKSALTVVIDHGAPTLVTLQKGANRLVVATGLNDGPHSVEILKRTETWQGVLTFSGVELSSGGSLLPPPSVPRRRLMFIGDSVTCGAGVDNNAQCKADPARPANDAYHSYGMLLGQRLDSQVHLVCYGGRGLTRDYRGLSAVDGVLNAPQFVDLAIPTDDAAARAPWTPSRWQPDGILISLGTNDFNLQKTKPLDGKQWVAAYVDFAHAVRGEYPQAEIFLTEGAIVTDPLLRQYVQQAVTDAHDPKLHYVAAEHYPGNGCDAHPTREQHEHIADDLEPVLRRAFGW